MSTAEKIFEKAQVLPETAQQAVLKFVEKLAGDSVLNVPGPRAGSAKGLIQIAPDFDEPLTDFKPYAE